MRWCPAARKPVGRPPWVCVRAITRAGVRSLLSVRRSFRPRPTKETNFTATKTPRVMAYESDEVPSYEVS